MSLVTGRRVDAHLHLWDLSRGDYDWLGPQHGALFRSFGPEEARAELEAAGVDSAVLVQAADSLRDTEYLLDVAAHNEWVAGVVGWIPLDDPAAAERALATFAADPKLRGIRHLVHDDPRIGFLDLPEVRESLEFVAGHGLAFDVPDAWPGRHLDQAAGLARALPQLTVVVDHLAKPPIGGDDFADWSAALARIGELPNTVAKVSGLTGPGYPFTPAALRPAWDAALECFGPGRLLYGGDWPISVQVGGYGKAWDVYSQLIEELSPGEQSSILAGTATRVYGLAG